jgi:hypothetical protein
MEIKMPALRVFLFEFTKGLAYLRQAAESLASDSLRVPSKAAQAAFSTPQDAMLALANIEMEWA